MRFALSLLLLAAPAQAADMTLYLRNDTSRAIVVEMHSQTRAMRWPGGDKVWLLGPRERKATAVDCTPGERICYGAWLNGDAGTLWGVGPDNDRRCEDCCTLCTPGTPDSFVIGG